MKKILLAVAIVSAFTGCYKDAQSTKTEGNGVKVELLFVHDSIKVYRFFDGGHAHYFTDRGESMGTEQSGKAIYEQNIK